MIAHERVAHNGTVPLERPDDKDSDDPERLTQTALEQISENKAESSTVPRGVASTARGYGSDIGAG